MPGSGIHLTTGVQNDHFAVREVHRTGHLDSQCFSDALSVTLTDGRVVSLPLVWLLRWAIKVIF